MFEIDEKELIEESKNHYKTFLKKQRRSLVTFTGDSSLTYMPDIKLERFVLDSSKGILYLPLERFLYDALDENEIMWHIYYELALYPDWKKHTKEYLNRKNDWQKEIDEMTIYILSKIKKEGLENDCAYKSDIISNYVKEEILNFLHKLDKYTSFLRVLELCPIYRDKGNFNNIVKYMKNIGKDIDLIFTMPKHRVYSNSFLITEVYGKELKYKNYFDNFANKTILNRPFFDFVRYQFIIQINNNKGIIERDNFIHSFIFPIFEELWKNEIDEMTFYKSKDGKTGEIEKNKNPFEESEKSSENDLESTKDEEEKILKDILEKEEKIREITEEVIQGKVNLELYGVSDMDQELFQYYANKMKMQREQMHRFWEKLVGDAKKEVNIKKINQTKGKLDIDSFIDFYPEFIESENRGNYKELAIFNRYLLEPITKILPEKIEISFVIDNSGSMNKSKIDATRKALAVTLLSIDDFNKYLKNNSEKLNQKVEVLTETWFFGSKYYNVKEFNNKKNNNKEKSDIIKSIVKLNASDGATDDAGCLKEICDRITPMEEKNLKNGKQIKVVFEITDGESSFSGLVKNTLEELLSKNVEVYAFQIGKNNKKSQDLFNYIWNDDNSKERGIFIGEEIDKLPKELLRVVGNNMYSIFNN